MGSLPAGSSVRYVLSVPKNAVFYVAFQSRSGKLADTLVATVQQANGAVLASLRSAGSQATLYDLIAAIPASGADRELTIIVEGAVPSVGGAYSLSAKQLGVEPERSATALTSGQIVSEAVDVPGDVDEFVVQGSSQYVASVNVAAEVPFAGGLHVDLVDGTTLLTSIVTTDAQATLDELALPIVSLPRSGSYVIRVHAGAADVGPYRLRFSAIPPASPPEASILPFMQRVLDTISVTDSVVAWRVRESTMTSSYGVTLELVDAQPGDSLTATFVSRASLDSVAAIGVVEGGGPATYALPVGIPGSDRRDFIAIVRGHRPGMQVTYRMRLGSLLSDDPESVSPLMVLGDTIAGEAFDDPLDIDLFSFSPAPADSEWVVMAAREQAAPYELLLRVADRDERTVSAWSVTGATTELEPSATKLSLPDDRGPYTLAVHSSYDGAYRLRMARVDRSPEGVPAHLELGDTVQSALEQVGDIDEFTFDATAGDELYFHHYPGMRQLFHLYDGLTHLPRETLPGYALSIAEQHAHYRWTVPHTGTFMIRIHHDQVSGPAERWPSPYRAEIQRVNRAPESIASAGWAWRDTIRGEVLERRGDVDEFVVTFDSTRMMALSLIAHRAVGSDGALVTVLDQSGNAIAGANVSSGTEQDSMAVRPHITFEPGAYLFRLESTGLSPIPFEVFMTPSPLGPETVSDTLPLGTWVTGEAIDSIGDADRYSIRVDSGVRYLPEIELLAGATGDVSFDAAGSAATAAGQLIIREATATGWTYAIVQEWPSTEVRALGPYRVRLHRLDPLPETASPIIAIGDTIESESIDLTGDSDRFTFTGTAGTTLRLTAIPQGYANGARLSGRLFQPDGLNYFLANFDETPVEFLLPISGEYSFVIDASGWQSSNLGPYFLSLTQTP